MKIDPTKLEDCELQSLVRIVEAAQSPNQPLGGKPYLILEKDQRAEDIEKMLLVPTRKRGNPCFCRCESFIRYVNEHKDSGSRIYVLSNTQVVAVLDHNAEGPRWGEHKATYQLKAALEWQTWTAKDKQQMTQKQFCEFIEDNARDIEGRTNMVELVRTLQVNATVDYKSYDRGDNGNTALQFVRTTKTQAGERGEVELPQTFTIHIPAFEGGEAMAMNVKLRFDLTDSKLKLWFELQRVQQILNDHTAAVVESIGKETGIEPFFGTP